jgi:hypothetical protein
MINESQPKEQTITNGNIHNAKIIQERRLVGHNAQAQVIKP